MRGIFVVVGLLAVLIAGSAWLIFKPKEFELTRDAAVKAELRRDNDQARDLYLKSIKQAEECGGGTSSMVHALVGMPNVTFEQKEELLKRSLAQGEKFGDLSIELEYRLSALSNFYEYSNPPHLAEAEVYARRMLKNSIKQWGPKDPIFKDHSKRTYSSSKLSYPSGMYHRVAFILEKQAKVDEARELYKKAGGDKEEQLFLKRWETSVFNPANKKPSNSADGLPRAPVNASPYDQPY